MHAYSHFFPFAADLLYKFMIKRSRMVYDRKIYKEIGQAFVSPEIIGEISNINSARYEWLDSVLFRQ